MADKRQVDFHYLAFDIEMHPIFKHNMKWYRISPYYVYHANDTCYLIGAELEPDEGIDKVKHFRLDRICNLLPTDRECVDIQRYYKDPSAGLSEYIHQCIDHYGGEEVELELEVPYSENAMYIIRDMCGTDYTCHKTGPNLAKISFRVRTGPPLIGWIMQNAHFFKVIGPPSVVEEIRAEYRFGYEAYAANTGM